MTVEDVGQPHEHDGPRCDNCGLNFEFEIPPDVVSAAMRGDLVIFAGAGTSTEVPNVFPSTLYAQIKAELPEGHSDESFPGVMQAFENLRGRNELVQRIWHRFNYVDSFPGPSRYARKFARELSTMPYIQNILTTNWDTYFEEECAAVPIVVGDDYAFHGLSGRKVYKIHGSMSVVSSIVATQKDYDSCLQALAGNALGGTLRHLLSTKVTVFVGYSLTDDDFVQLFDVLLKDLGKARPKLYAVSPFPTAAAAGLGITEIATDGTYFLRELKAKCVEQGEYLPDEIYERGASIEYDAFEARSQVNEVSLGEYPALIYAYSYLDGVTDGCYRMMKKRSTGEYSDKHLLTHKLHSYDYLLKLALEEERFWDAAYIEGYLNLLLSTVLEGNAWEAFPPYFCFTSAGIYDLDTLLVRCRTLKRRNPKAWRAAGQTLAEIGPDMVPVHTPFV
jgi:hypothetical protein